MEPAGSAARWTSEARPQAENGDVRVKWDNTHEDELRHDVTDELAAYKLAQLPFPGVFGVFYQNDRPTKNALEPARRGATIHVGKQFRPSSARERKKWVHEMRDKLGQPSDLQLLQKPPDAVRACNRAHRL